MDIVSIFRVKLVRSKNTVWVPVGETKCTFLGREASNNCREFSNDKLQSEIFCPLRDLCIVIIDVIR